MVKAQFVARLYLYCYFMSTLPGGFRPVLHWNEVIQARGAARRKPHIEKAECEANLSQGGPVLFHWVSLWEVHWVASTCLASQQIRKERALPRIFLPVLFISFSSGPLPLCWPLSQPPVGSSVCPLGPAPPPGAFLRRCGGMSRV